MDLWKILILIGGTGTLVGLIAYSCTRRSRAVALFVTTIVFTQPLFGEANAADWSSRITVSECAGALLFLTWLLHRYISPVRSRLKSPAFLLAWASLLTLAGLSQIWFSGGNYLEGRAEIYALAYLTITYFLLTQLVRTERDLRVLMEAWVFTAFVLFSLGMWEAVALLVGIPRPPFPFLNGPVPGSFSFPLTFRNGGQLGAYTIVTLFIVMSYSALPENSRRKQRLAYLTVLMGLVVLFFSSKRSAYLGLGAGMAVLIFHALKKRRMPKTVLALPFLALVIIGGALYKSEDLQTWAAWRTSLIKPQEFQENAFVRSNWGGGLRAFFDHPWLGIGYGGFESSRYDSTGHEIHNSPLRMMAELGLLGILLFAFFQLLIFWAAVGVVSARAPTLRSNSGIFLLAGLVAVFVSQIYHLHFRNREYWLMLVVLTVLSRPQHPSLNVQPCYPEGDEMAKVVLPGPRLPQRLAPHIAEPLD